MPCCVPPWNGSSRSQLGRRDASLLARIEHHRQIIAFRNVLIHGYAEIDDALVWDVIQSRLEPLRQQVNALLASP